MKLDRVTITGADNSVENMHEIFDLSQQFPFVEWGILVSHSSVGKPRFPSLMWIETFKHVIGAQEEKIRWLCWLACSDQQSKPQEPNP